MLIGQEPQVSPQQHVYMAMNYFDIALFIVIGSTDHTDSWPAYLPHASGASLVHSTIKQVKICVALQHYGLLVMALKDTLWRDLTPGGYFTYLERTQIVSSNYKYTSALNKMHGLLHLTKRHISN